MEELAKTALLFTLATVIVVIILSITITLMFPEGYQEGLHEAARIWTQNGKSL